jgi:tetratricopeptide (TPR) repeat protein
LASTRRAEEAYNQWQQAIALDPDYLDAHNNLGDLLVNLGRDGDAAIEYHEALRIDPTNAHATEQLRRLEHSRAR